MIHTLQGRCDRCFRLSMLYFRGTIKKWEFVCVDCLHPPGCSFRISGFWPEPTTFQWDELGEEVIKYTVSETFNTKNPSRWVFGEFKDI